MLIIAKCVNLITLWGNIEQYSFENSFISKEIAKKL